MLLDQCLISPEYGTALVSGAEITRYRRREIKTPKGAHAVKGGKLARMLAGATGSIGISVGEVRQKIDNRSTHFGNPILSIMRIPNSQAVGRREYCNVWCTNTQGGMCG